MFRRLDAATDEEIVTITLGGRPLVARAGDSLAAALLAGGHLQTGASPVSGAPRAPFCLMGSCQQCLMEVDGARDVRACMTPVRAGMRVEPQDQPVIASGAGGADPWGVDE